MDGETTTLRCGGMCDAVVVEDEVLTVLYQNGAGAPRERLLSVPLVNVRHFKLIQP